MRISDTRRVHLRLVACLLVVPLLAAGFSCSDDGSEADADQARYDRVLANQEEFATIVADPAAFGSREEVLDALGALALPGATVDDTGLGEAPLVNGYDATLFNDVDGTIEVHRSWLAGDGATGGSLWTWAGTADNGEPFELIGVNVTRYDDDGLIIDEVVDWPYPAAEVEAAFTEGNLG